MGSGSDESRVLCWTRVGLGNDYRFEYNGLGVGDTSIWVIQTSNRLPRVSDPLMPPVSWDLPPSDVPQSRKFIRAKIDLGDSVPDPDPVVSQQSSSSFNGVTARTVYDDVTAPYPTTTPSIGSLLHLTVPISPRFL